MIGGRVINEHPMQAVAVLSDRNIHLCQGDANQALVLARRLLGLEARGQAQSIARPQPSIRSLLRAG